MWPHKGKVAAVGIGHSPTLRRWDGDPQKAIGAWAFLAIRKAIEDAGVNPADVDGIVLDPDTTTGAFWPEDEPVPADFLAAFQNTSDPFDGLIKLSPDQKWNRSCVVLVLSGLWLVVTTAPDTTICLRSKQWFTHVLG